MSINKYSKIKKKSINGIWIYKSKKKGKKEVGRGSKKQSRRNSKNCTSRNSKSIISKWSIYRSKKGNRRCNKRIWWNKNRKDNI